MGTGLTVCTLWPKSAKANLKKSLIYPTPSSGTTYMLEKYSQFCQSELLECQAT